MGAVAASVDVTVNGPPTYCQTHCKSDRRGRPPVSLTLLCCQRPGRCVHHFPCWFTSTGWLRSSVRPIHEHDSNALTDLSSVLLLSHDLCRLRCSRSSSSRHLDHVHTSCSLVQSRCRRPRPRDHFTSTYAQTLKNPVLIVGPESDILCDLKVYCRTVGEAVPHRTSTRILWSRLVRERPSVR